MKSPKAVSEAPTENRNPSCDECAADMVMGPAIMRGTLIFSLPAPARHHDVIRAMAEAGVRTPIGHEGDVQGFLTRYGFKDRLLTGSLVFGYRKQVTSEDLW